MVLAEEGLHVLLTQRSHCHPLLRHKAAATHPLFNLLVSTHNVPQLDTLCPKCFHLQQRTRSLSSMVWRGRGSVGTDGATFAVPEDAESCCQAGAACLILQQCHPGLG